MKHINYLLFAFFSLAFVSCSSIDTVKDFSSKEKFYNDFNDFAKNKNVEVTLINDSSFTTSEGASISNDTLILNIKNENELSLSEIVNMKYNNTSFVHSSADIILKDGEKLNVENIKILHDSSIQFTNCKGIKEYLPLNKVKKASYLQRLPGVMTGLSLGTITGAITGVIVLYVLHSSVLGSNSELSNSPDAAFMTYIFSGAIIGSVIGWITGHNYVYQFNP
ncbi:MAG: hypothetical protein ACYDEE_11735 [Ignavibacteriaceae bacterium]